MATAGAEPAPAARRNGSLKIGPLAAPSTPPIPAVTRHPGTVVRRRSSDGGTTPTGIRRPTPDDLPDHEIDPGLMAAAMAELDAELSHRNDPDG